MNYYYLIAGLPEIEIETNKLVFSLADFKNEVHPHLSVSDMRLFDLFYTKFDNQNLLHYLKDKEAKFDERGNIIKEELEESLKFISEGGNPKNHNIPPYFKVFVEEYNDAQQMEIETAKWENRLTELYYQWTMKCGSKMIASWFEFNLNLNNILAAYASRKYQMAVEAVGDNEVAESIKTSGQRDFGLTGTIDELETFQRLADDPDLYEREKKIDLLRWQWLDEQTFFEYFSMEWIFAYLVKLEIIERWVNLNPVEGGKRFRELTNSLKNIVVNHFSF